MNTTKSDTSNINRCLVNMLRVWRDVASYASMYAFRRQDGRATHQARKMALRRIEEMRGWLNNLEEDIKSDEE